MPNSHFAADRLIDVRLESPRRDPGAASDLSCRAGCGACCIAPSIHSPIPGMPAGKPAGVRCVQLLDDQRCALFGKPERPAFCQRLRPSVDMCGHDRDHALSLLDQWERSTSPE